MTSRNGYATFLERKTQLDAGDGFEPLEIPDFLFPFQRDLVDWAIRQGRGALFTDCGTGKTAMELVWADNVWQHTHKPVLILTPLAVGFQAQAEAEKFGMGAEINRTGSLPDEPIVITNYERLHLFDWEDYGGVVCDESSILKNFDGARRAEVTDFMLKVPYRLLGTATAAPNDYTELGTSSEALGYLGHMDMLGRFFVNNQRNAGVGRYHGKQAEWRFKGHAQEPFWRWVSSWARALRRPSDLGFDDEGFVLPELRHRQHVVEARRPPADRLFDVPAESMFEEREELRRTIAERCETAAGLVSDADSAVVWCQLNDEGDLLERYIDGAVQVSGSDSTDRKEEVLGAFSRGEVRVLVTKPKLGAWGLNWQHCNRMVFFPSHSYEQYYQAVRRSWRFGQKRPVLVDIVTTEGGAKALANLERKAAQADRMFESLMEHMRDALSIERGVTYDQETELPTWF